MASTRRQWLVLGLCVVVGLGAITAFSPGLVGASIDTTSSHSGSSSLSPTASVESLDDPYDDDDGEGPIVDEDDVVVRDDADGSNTVISGLIAERGGQAATVETDTGVAVSVDDDERLVTEAGERVQTLSGTPVNRFDVDDGGDVRTADEPFEQLVVQDGQIVTESGEAIVDTAGNVLVANPDGIDYEVEFRVEIQDVTEPDEGNPVEVTAEINNTGLAADNQTIEALFQDDLRDSTSVSLDGESTTTVDFELPTEEGDWGFDRTVTVRSDDDTARTMTNVSRGGLRVSDSNWNAPIEAGETFETSITIERAGDLGPDRTVSYELVFLVEDDVQIRRIVSLDSGESTTESFEYETDTSDPPTLPHRITIGDREFPAEPRVYAPEFAVEIDDTTDDVVAGEMIQIDGTVRNEGSITDRQNLTLELNETDTDVGWRPVDRRAVEVAPGNETNVSFFYRTSAGTPSEPQFRLSTNASQDEGSSRVHQADTNLTVVDFVADPPTTDPGAIVSFNASIQNAGESAETLGVTLNRGPEQFHQTEVTVSGGETETVVLPAEAPAEPGTYEYEAVIYGDAAITELEVEGDGPSENETDDSAGTETDGNETDSDIDTDVEDSTDGNTTDGNETAADSTDETDDPDAARNETDDSDGTADEAPDDDSENETEETEPEAEEEGLPWLTIGGGVFVVLLLVGVAVAATRTENLPIDLPDSPETVVQSARASAAVAAGTVVNRLPVDVDIGATGQVTVANVTPDSSRFKIRCRTPEEVTLFEEQSLEASDTIDLDGLPSSGPLKIEINVKDGPRDDIEITSDDPISAAQVVIQAYDIDFTVE